MINTKRFSVLFFSHRILIIAFNFLALASIAQSSREKISINKGWRFIKSDPSDANGLVYDVRPEVTDRNDNVVADTKPTEAITTATSEKVLKKWTQAGLEPCFTEKKYLWCFAIKCPSALRLKNGLKSIF